MTNGQVNDLAPALPAAADPGCAAVLLSIARCPRPSDHDTLSRQASALNDWNYLIQLAAEHRMLPAMYARMMEAAVAMPPLVEGRLQREYEINGLLCLANAAELVAVLQDLDRLSIPALPFKGVVLAVSAYGSLSARPAGDLDVLIRRGDLARAQTAMHARGYELLTPVNDDGGPVLPEWYEYHFERPSDGMVLELRWKLEMQHPRYQRDLDLEWLWPHRRQVRLAGADVADISPEILLLILCMHGCKHAWSRLIWTCDVAKLLATHSDLDWAAVFREAKHAGLERPLAVGVLLAHQVGGVSAPDAILRRFENDRVALKLVRYVVRNLFSRPDADRVGRILYDARLAGLRNLSRYLLSFDFLRRYERDRILRYVGGHLPMARRKV